MSTQLSKRKKVSDETEIGDVTAVASDSTNTVGAVKADSEDDMVEDQPNADVDAAEASEEVSTPQEIPVYENFVDDPLRNDVTEPYRLEKFVFFRFVLNLFWFLFMGFLIYLFLLLEIDMYKVLIAK